MLLRSSFLSTAHRCLAEAYYKYHLGLTPIGSGRPNKDLFFGSAVHEAVVKAIKEGEEVAIQYLDSLLWPPTKAKSKRVAVALVRRYMRCFSPTYVSDERSFIFPVGKHLWRGRFDIIGYTDGTIVVENKTTKPAFLIQKPNNQFISYYHAARNIFPDFTQFVVYNLDPGMLEIHQYPIRFFDEEIDYWLKTTAKFADYAEECFETGHVPRSDTNCIRFNSRICSYYDICTSHGKVQENVINNCFNVSEEVKKMNY